MSANHDSKPNQDSEKRPETFSNELDRLVQKNSEYQDHLESLRIVVPSAHKAETWSKSCYLPGFQSGTLPSTLLPSLESSLNGLAWYLDTSVVKQDPPAIDILASKLEQSIDDMELYCKEFTLRESSPIPERWNFYDATEVYKKYLKMRSTKVQDTILEYLLPTCSQLISTIKLCSNDVINSTQIQAKDSTIKSANFSTIGVVTSQLIQSLDKIKQFVGQRNFEIVQFLWQESVNSITIIYPTAEYVYLPEEYLVQFMEMAAVVFKLVRIFLKKLLKSATANENFMKVALELSMGEVSRLMHESLQLYIKLQGNTDLIHMDDDKIRVGWIYYFNGLKQYLESIFSLVNSELLAASTDQITENSSSDTVKKTCLDTWYHAWKVQFTIAHQQLMQVVSKYRTEIEKALFDD